MFSQEVGAKIPSTLGSFFLSNTGSFPQILHLYISKKGMFFINPNVENFHT